MSFFKSKKFLLTLIIFLIIAIIGVFIHYQIQKNKKAEISNQTSKEISKKADNYKASFNPNQVQASLNILNNNKLSDKERYKALKDITFYFSIAYANSHDPDVRVYVLSLKDFAKKNFPKDYQEADFNIPCADPGCGEKPDEEIKQIRKEINESGIDPEYLRTINANFDQASYIPISEDFDKQYGFGLVLSQLEDMNNPKASAAAQRLKNYLKVRYSFDYTKSKQ